MAWLGFRYMTELKSVGLEEHLGGNTQVAWLSVIEEERETIREIMRGKMTKRREAGVGGG